MSALLKRIGMELPIVQAPMAGVSTSRMAAAVSNAGGLGSIAIGAENVAGARRMIEELKRLTEKPFNVNVFAHKPAVADRPRELAWLDALKPIFQRLDAEPPKELREIYTSFVVNNAMQDLLVETAPPVASFHFGLPAAAVISRLKAAGVMLLSSATNLSEAKQAADAGIDAIVAQGFEAGGHRGVFDPASPDSRLGAFALTRLLAQEMSLPIIAAGGIMDGAGIAAVLDLGATAAQLGTAFIACPESSADDDYRDALFGAGATATTMTSLISGRPARSLPNAFTALESAELKGVPVPAYPIAYDAAKAIAHAAKAKGERGFAVQWAGQGAPLARAMPAASLIETLAKELAAARGRGQFAAAWATPAG
jgi:nitronate monooxygenase